MSLLGKSRCLQNVSAVLQQGPWVAVQDSEDMFGFRKLIYARLDELLSQKQFWQSYTQCQAERLPGKENREPRESLCGRGS